MPTRESRRVVRVCTLGLSPKMNRKSRGTLARVKGGSAKYYENARFLPPGPQCPQDFAAWPDTLLKDLISGKSGGTDCSIEGWIRFKRLLNVLCGGSVAYTDFSGKQCPEHVVRMVGKSAASHCDKASHEESAARSSLKDEQCPWLACLRACDNSKLCRRLIMNGRYPPVHMQADLSIRLPEKPRQKSSLAGIRHVRAWCTQAVNALWLGSTSRMIKVSGR